MLERMRMLWSRLAATLWPGRRDREMADELDFHLEMQTEENLRRGMAPEEARRQARLSFGGLEPIKEECRDRRCLAWLRDSLRDLRFGARQLRRNPIFALAAIGTLALGIGANTAIFSIVDASLHPLPFQHPEELVRLHTETRVFSDGASFQTESDELPPAEFQELRQAKNVTLAAWGLTDPVSLRTTEATERIQAGAASINLFPLLGVRPAAGRLFLPEEARPAAPPVVLISHALWLRKFGGNPDTLASSITLDGVAYTVIGVLPRSLTIPLLQICDVWIPLRSDTQLRLQNQTGLRVIGRLQANIQPAAAQAELDSLYQPLRQKRPDNSDNPDHPNNDAAASSQTVKQDSRLLATQWQEELLGESRSMRLLFLGVVGCVLLIACANTANLLVARTIYRENEIRMRAALGASAGRIFRQLMTESLLLALLGGGAGFILAFWLIKLPVVRPLEFIMKASSSVALNLEVAGFTLLLSLLTALLTGLIPAMHALGSTGSLNMNSGSRTTVSKGMRRVFRILIAAEIALVLVLLISSGLLLRTLTRLGQVDPGFKAENVLTMAIELPAKKYSDTKSKLAYFAQALERLRNMPGIATVGVTSYPPFGNFRLTSLVTARDGYVELAEAGGDPVATALISEDYLRTMQITLLEGRGFSALDRPQSPHVVIVDRAFALTYFPGQSALGRQIKSLTAGDWTIVGVAGSVRNIALSDTEKPQIYIPCWQVAGTPMDIFFPITIVARGQGEGGEITRLIAPIRQMMRDLDPDQPDTNIDTMQGQIASTLWEQRTHLWVIGAFAALSLALAFIGIYGVVSFSVNRRVHEIGIRVALGASPGQIVRLLLGETLLTCACGLVAGTLLAFAATRALVSLLYGVTATDPATFAGAILFVALVVLAAGLIPAIRAARLDPAQCQRHE